MNWCKKHGATILLIGVLIAGVCLLLYPSFSDYWNTFHQTKAIMSYSENVANLEADKYEEILNAAKAYNKRIAENGILWTLTEERESEYKAQLNVDGTGNMGYIDIPKIDIKLPIYHGTSDTVLQAAIGHMEGTSLPVGGEGSHCVLSGHRGLPSAKLFSDLDKLVEGDTFTLTILNETLTYEVDRIRVVEPADLTELQLVPGEYYCTLVTCTPYGINTHRLLVRGHRVENPDGGANVIADALQIEPIYIAPFVALPILAVLFLILMTATRKKAPDEEVDFTILEAEHKKSTEKKVKDQEEKT